MSKFIPQKKQENVGIPLEIAVMNPKRKSKHISPCLMPLDCVEMTEDVFAKSYGPHIVKSVFDLLQHQAFRQGLDQPVDRKLIVDP